MRKIYRPLLQRNAEYAKRKGYDYVLHTRTEHVLPPYWIKVKLVQEALSSYDYVVWVDSDAVIHDFAKNIPDFFCQHDLLVIAPDPPIADSPFMAAVFMVRGRNEAAKHIVDEWMGRYNPDAWRLAHGKWECPGCVWAKGNYEQGEFVALMPKYAGFIKSVPYYVFHEYRPWRKDPRIFSYHFFGGNALFKKLKIAGYLRRHERGVAFAPARQTDFIVTASHSTT